MTFTRRAAPAGPAPARFRRPRPLRPLRPLRLIVPFAPGGAAGLRVVVENRRAKVARNLPDK